MFDEITESPEIAGLLYKRRGGFGKIMPNAWQYRFFVITKEGMLLYFDTAEEGHSESKARGRVDLRATHYELSMEPIEGAPTPYFLQIAIPTEEKWKLCAETKEDQGRWYNVLDKFSKMTKIPTTVNYMSDDESDKSRRGSSVITKPGSADGKPSSPTANSDAKKALPPGESPNNSFVSSSASTGTAAASQATAGTATAPSTMSTSAGGGVSTTGTTTIVSGVAKPSQTGKPSSKKKFLKSNKPSPAETLQWYETFFTLAIINICCLGVYRAQSWPLVTMYVLVCNGVVFHTLALRARRWAQAQAQAAASGSSASNAAATAQAKATDALLLTPDTISSGIVEIPELKAAPVAVEEKAVDTEPVKRIGGKPVAGATFTEVKMTVDGSEPPIHSWSKTDPRLFNVRIGPDYNRFKKKAPSGPAIYEPVAFDIFCTKKRVDHVATRFHLPDTSNRNTHHPHVPPLLIIQVQIPSEPPTSIFSSAEDGPGWALVMYYRITEESCQYLKDLANAPPAIKLFAEWCEKAPHDPAWRGRFKVICLCTNFEELGFPSMITSYNGKPVLIRRTGTIFTGPGYLEMNIHVHKFANMAKQSIYMLTSRCNTMFMNIGFVIEGREDKELPETLFACVAVNRPQEDQSEFLFDEE